MGTGPEPDAVERSFGSVGLSEADPTTLVVRGEVDLAVTQKVVSQLPAWAGVRQADLTAATFLDSSGMRLLVQLARTVAPQRLRVVGASGQPLAALELFGAGHVVDLVPADHHERPTGT